MRIPSGSTDRVVYFIAVDATDLKTRETGLTGFTVYRSRNGGASTAWTTPTISEVDATNMPGVYGLVVDEDTTIGATHDTEEMVVHITQAAMAPVDRVLELYRPETTEGSTLLVDAAGIGDADVRHWLGSAPNALATGRVDASVGAMAADVITAAAIAADAIGSSELAASAATEIADAVWNSTRAGHVTAGTFGEGVASVTGSVGSVATGGIASTSFVAGAITASAIAADAIGSSELAASAVTEIAAAVWDEATAGHGTVGSFGQVVFDDATTNTDTNDQVSTRLPAALVGGRMDSSVGAVAAGAMTASGFAASAITSAVLATDAIGAAQVAASAVTEIQTGLATTSDVATINSNISAVLNRLPDLFPANGTADSGTTTTMVDAARTEAATDYWRGCALIMTSGANAGQVRTITAFTPGTDTITVAPAFTSAIGTGDTYEILSVPDPAPRVWDEARASHATAGTFGEGVSVADIVSAAANKIADHVLRRPYGSARASSDGDALAFRSLLGAMGKLVNRWAISGSTLTVYQEDDATATAPGGTQTITGTAGADPITQINTD